MNNPFEVTFVGPQAPYTMPESKLLSVYLGRGGLTLGKSYTCLGYCQDGWGNKIQIVLVNDDGKVVTLDCYDPHNQTQVLPWFERRF